MNRFAVENLFGIVGFNIAWYGVIIAIGMMMGLFLAMYRSEKYGISSETIFDFVLFAIPSLLVGQIVGRWRNFTNQEVFGKYHRS